MKLDLSGKLNFHEIDLSSPAKVIEEILAQLPEQTNNIIYGIIKTYDGQLESSMANIQKAIASLAKTSIDVNVQDKLGAIEEKKQKYECYIYTPIYEHYKYRIFFVQHGIDNYPVKVYLEESVARSIDPEKEGVYIYLCDNKEELEQLIADVFTSDKMISVMQEIIRIYQAKKAEEGSASDSEDTESEE